MLKKNKKIRVEMKSNHDGIIRTTIIINRWVLQKEKKKKFARRKLRFRDIKKFIQSCTARKF